MGNEALVITNNILGIIMFTKNKIVLALGFTAAMLGNCANATIISTQLDAEVTVRAGTENSSDSDTSATMVNVSQSLFSDGSSAEGNARADDTGWFYATSRAAVDSETNSGITQTYMFQNQGDDAFFDFNFVVENGSLNVNCDDGYGDGYGNNSFVDAIDIVCDGPATGTASYVADISVNSASVWNSSAALDLAADVYTLNTSGVLLNDSMFDNEPVYFWSERMFTIDLGLVMANEIVEIVYSVSTQALASQDANAYAQFNDPFSINRTPITITPAPTNVSAPSAFLLLGLSLFGLAGYRAKR
jgi:hypothetical protein